MKMEVPLLTCQDASDPQVCLPPWWQGRRAAGAWSPPKGTPNGAAALEDTREGFGSAVNTYPTIQRSELWVCTQVQSHVHIKLHTGIQGSSAPRRQNLEATKVPSVGDGSIQTREYFSALKVNELSRHEKTWGKRRCTK